MSMNIFPDKNFNRFYQTPTFLSPLIMFFLNLISPDIDIISAGISIFDDLTIFVMLKDFLNWKWSVCDVIFFMLSRHYRA